MHFRILVMTIMNLTVYQTTPTLYKLKTCVCCEKSIADSPCVAIRFTHSAHSVSSYYHLSCCVISCDKTLLSSINVF